MKIEFRPNLSSGEVWCHVQDKGVHILISLTYEEVREVRNKLDSLLDTYDKWGD